MRAPSCAACKNYFLQTKSVSIKNIEAMDMISHIDGLGYFNNINYSQNKSLKKKHLQAEERKVL